MSKKLTAEYCNEWLQEHGATFKAVDYQGSQKVTCQTESGERFIAQLDNIKNSVKAGRLTGQVFVTHEPINKISVEDWNKRVQSKNPHKTVVDVERRNTSTYLHIKCCGEVYVQHTQSCLRNSEACPKCSFEAGLAKHIQKAMDAQEAAGYPHRSFWVSDKQRALAGEVAPYILKASFDCPLCGNTIIDGPTLAALKQAKSYQCRGCKAGKKLTVDEHLEECRQVHPTLDIWMSDEEKNSDKENRKKLISYSCTTCGHSKENSHPVAACKTRRQQGCSECTKAKNRAKGAYVKKEGKRLTQDQLVARAVERQSQYGHTFNDVWLSDSEKDRTDCKATEKRLSIDCPECDEVSHDAVPLNVVTEERQGTICPVCKPPSLFVDGMSLQEVYQEKHGREWPDRFEILDDPVLDRVNCYKQVRCIKCELVRDIGVSSLLHQSGNIACLCPDTSAFNYETKDQWYKAFQLKYGYPCEHQMLDDYQGNKTLIDFLCPEGHTFESKPNDVMSLHGCRYCNAGGFDKGAEMAVNYCYQVVLQIYNDLYLCSKFGETMSPNEVGTRMRPSFHEAYAPICYTREQESIDDVPGGTIVDRIEKWMHKHAKAVRLPVVQAPELKANGPKEIFLGLPFNDQLQDFTNILAIRPDNQEELLEAIEAMPSHAVQEAKRLAEQSGVSPLFIQ